MKKSEFDELVVVNAALDGKYDAIVTELSTLLDFAILEDFGSSGKFGALIEFIEAIAAFESDLTGLKKQCNDRWLDAKFLTTEKEDPIISKKGLDSLKSFFADGNNFGHSFFETTFFIPIEDQLNKISGGMKFSALWEEIICASLGTIEPILSAKKDIGDNATTLVAARKIAIENKDVKVFKYFTDNYRKQFNQKKVHLPKTKKLFTILSELYDKCYTLTATDYKTGLLAFEKQCNASLSAAKKSNYKDCTVLAKKLKSKIYTAFENLSAKEAVFPIIGKALMDAAGNENLSLDLISDNFKNLNLPTFDEKRGDGLMTEPTYIQDVLSEIDLQEILEKALDEKEACFIEKEEGLAEFKDKLEKAIKAGFMEDLNEHLNAPSDNYIPNLAKVKRAITFWFSENNSYATYRLFLVKIEAKMERIYSQNFVGIDDLKKSVAALFLEEKLDIHPLAVSLWAEIGKKNCLKYDYNALADLYLPHPAFLKQGLERSTIDISKKEFIEYYLPKWKTRASIFVGEGIKAIRNYKFESTKFKIKNFTEYLKNKVFTKDERSSYLADFVLSDFGGDTAEVDLKEKETTEVLSKIWKAVLTQFDEKVYFAKLYEQYILSQDERVLVDFKNKIHFILPNKEDFEFALLSAVMNHSTKKGKSNATWISVESYKLQRSDAENWLERTKFAIDSFYECVHSIRGEYNVATRNYWELANACKVTFKADNECMVEFATLMFGSVISLATSALEINKVISGSALGKLVKAGRDGFVGKAAKWVAGNDELYVSDAKFIFGGIGGEATFDTLTAAIANIKEALLWSIDMSNMGIRNTLEFEINGIENSIAALNYDKADYTTFINELSKKVEEFIAKIEALQFDGLALKFEKLMVANWLKKGEVLKSSNGESSHAGWDFTLPRTEAFHKKMESYGVIEHGAFDGGDNPWDLIWKMFAKGIYKEAYKEDWARFVKAFNAMEKWSVETADLRSCNLFR